MEGGAVTRFMTRVLALATALLTIIPTLTVAAAAPTERLPAVEIVEYIKGDTPGSGTTVTLRHTGDAGPIGDRDADLAYEYANLVLAYYVTRFGRSSFDGHGAKLIVYVRDRDEDSLLQTDAEWEHERLVITLGAHWVTLGVVAHEFAHGVRQTISPPALSSSDDTMALSEGVADILAANVTRRWTVGEGTPAGVFRDLASPMRLGHPFDVDRYNAEGTVNVVHPNSLIISHAYYLLVREIGRHAAEEIVWRALPYLGPESGFEDFHAACMGAATDLFGLDSHEHAAVDAVFHDVGLDGTWEVPERTRSRSR
jgi:bacillolysin